MNILLAARRLVDASFLRAFLVSQVIALTGLITGWLLFRNRLNDWNFHALPPQLSGSLAPFLHWDGQHYFMLAQSGFPVPPNASSAFYPLFPFLVNSFAGITRLPVGLAAVLVVQLTTLALIGCLGRLYGRRKSYSSALLLFLSFPTAFYLYVAYAESLFLLLLVVLMILMRRNVPALGIFTVSVLLPLARGQGLWMILPALIALLAACCRVNHPKVRVYLVTVAGLTIGGILYFTFYWLIYGDPTVGLAMQSRFVFGNSVSNLFDLHRFVAAFLTPSSDLFAYTNSVFDKSVFLLMVVGWAYGVRFVETSFVGSAWTLCLFAPALMGNFGSYSRFALLPWLFFCLSGGARLSNASRVLLVSSGFILQFFLAARFGGNHWVA